MDAELRATIRALQRADRSMSELNLHELLDDAGLVDLMHHCVVARLQLLGATYYVGRKSRGNGETHALTISDDPADGPRVLYTSVTRLGVHNVSKIVQGENPLVSLPVSVTSRLQTEWYSVSSAGSHDPVYRGYGCNCTGATFKRIGVYAVPGYQDGTLEFHLARVWKETQTSFDQFKNKKLREMGMIPGRNG